MAGFVVIEGIDGCGKSTVSRLVAERLEKRAVLTSEPTDSWLGQAVRRGDASSLSPYADALLFMADRAQHTIEISEHVRRGKVVICDRYYHSTVAYQAAALRRVFRGDAFKWLLDANLRISVRPDITALLLVPPETGLERLRGRSGLSRFEKLSFLKEVHRNYLRLARLDRSIRKIDATREVNRVVEDILELIRQKKL